MVRSNMCSWSASFNNFIAHMHDDAVKTLTPDEQKELSPIVSAFVPPGRFVATWDGYINVRIRDFYIFSAQGRGKLTVNIDDKPALEASGEDFSTKPGEAVKLSIIGIDDVNLCPTPHGFFDAQVQYGLALVGVGGNQYDMGSLFHLSDAIGHHPWFAG